MLQFFRKIRQNLLAEGQTGKYLKYAIGEIILVVIGILIALQINNWNTRKQEAKLGISYLKEIRGNLVTDTLTISEALAFNIKKMESIDSTFIELASPESPSNRMEAIGKRYGILGSHKFFVPNSLGFSNLMSSGNIELISNDTIRQLLSAYYNFDYEAGTQKRAVDLTRDFVDYVGPKLATKEMFLRFRSLELDIPSYNDIDIFKDQNLYFSLDIMDVVTGYQNVLFESKQEEIKGLINQIDKEIDN